MAQCPAMQQGQPEPIKGVFKLPDDYLLVANAATFKCCVSLLHSTLCALGYAGGLLTDLANGKVNNENYPDFMERAKALEGRMEVISGLMHETDWLKDEVLLYDREFLKEREE